MFNVGRCCKGFLMFNVVTWDFPVFKRLTLLHRISQCPTSDTVAKDSLCLTLLHGISQSQRLSFLHRISQ